MPGLGMPAPVDPMQKLAETAQASMNVFVREVINRALGVQSPDEAVPGYRALDRDQVFWWNQSPGSRRQYSDEAVPGRRALDRDQVFWWNQSPEKYRQGEERIPGA